ncbi:MAG: hypothetical protein ACREQN_14095, partial [Candidatus Binataceae bacterium]
MSPLISGTSAQVIFVILNGVREVKNPGKTSEKEQNPGFLADSERTSPIPLLASPKAPLEALG